MPRTCTVCANPERTMIDSMIADSVPYLQIATKYGLNQRTVNTHGKNHVKPFINQIEQQAQAAVLARVMTYRDEVNLPLSEKSKYIENKLWANYYALDKPVDRMAVVREIAKQQAEQAKLSGAYTEDRKNPATISDIARETVARLVAQGWDEDDARLETGKILPETENVSNLIN